MPFLPVVLGALLLISATTVFPDPTPAEVAESSLGSGAEGQPGAGAGLQGPVDATLVQLAEIMPDVVMPSPEPFPLDPNMLPPLPGTLGPSGSAAP